MLPLLLLLFLLAASSAGSPCPPNGSVVTNTNAIACANLWLSVAADNVTLVIEGATGSINVASNAAGTTLRLLDSAVTGNLTLGGPHAFADIRRSTITGVDVISFACAVNATIVVADSTLTGAVVASVLSDAAGAAITITNSTLNATRYAASVVGATILNVAITVSNSRLALFGGDNVGVVALAAATLSQRPQRPPRQRPQRAPRQRPQRPPRQRSQRAPRQRPRQGRRPMSPMALRFPSPQTFQ